MIENSLIKEVEKKEISKIQTITKPIEPKKHALRYNIHRYFTRRPYNVINTYIQHFTNKGDIVLDPFIGSGVTSVEALCLGRKTIAFDIEPLSTFITRMVCISPVDIVKLKNTFIKIEDSIKKDIHKFYKTSNKKIEKDFDKIVDQKNLWYPKGIRLPKNADVDTVDQLFTKKQLLALSTILKEIQTINDSTIRDLMKFTFSATLTFVNKMYDRGSSSPFAVYRYWMPKKIQEVNALKYFKRRFDALLKGKGETNKLIGDFYKEGDTFKIYNQSSTELSKFIERNSIDYVFTDPPYGANIAYIDLSTMWDSWLGFKVKDEYREKEVIEGGDLNKTQNQYKKLLYDSFEQLYDILKPGRWMSLVFHHKELKLWNAVINGCKDMGFEYVNTVAQPTKIFTLHKIKAPLRTLAGELIINFKKSKERIGERVIIHMDVKKVILNTAERIIVQNNGATTDDIYHAIIPELLDSNLIDVAVKEINDITPILKKEFILDKNKKWQLKEGTKLGGWIPIRDRIKFYTISLLKREKEATIDEIHNNILPLLINGRQPETKELLEILEEIAEPKNGKWKLKEKFIQIKQTKITEIGKVLPKIMFEETGEKENHNEMIYALANLGKFGGFKIWIGKKEQGQKYENMKLSNMCDYEEIPFLNINKDAQKVIEQIDIIWFDSNNVPVAAFEIENTTNVTEGIRRFFNLIKIEPEISSKSRLFIVSPNKNEARVIRRLKDPAYFGYPLFMEEKWRYILYDKLINIYELIRKTNKKVTLKDIDSIAKSVIINR